MGRNIAIFPSDESDYHTDYEEEMAESALSDMELYNHYSEHTEEELTADTVSLAYTNRFKGTFFTFVAFYSCSSCRVFFAPTVLI